MWALPCLREAFEETERLVIDVIENPKRKMNHYYRSNRVFFFKKNSRISLFNRWVIAQEQEYDKQIFQKNKQKS